jgi:predicted AlkP superfamily phosphohydrolase/phosphomutase
MMRVIIFGLDGASPVLIRRWLDDLPAFAQVTAEGTWGSLQSTNPPYTSPAWTAMMTGMNPAKMGIFGLRTRREGAYAWAPTTSADRRAATIWEVLSQAGHDSIVLNVPDTYPPTELRGALVSGRPAPVGTRSAISYPRELRDELDRVVGVYPIGPPAAFDDSTRHMELATWERVIAKQHDALEYLMATRAWSLSCAVSMAIDGISHHFWPYVDSQHPHHDRHAPAEIQSALKRIYQVEDRRLQRLMAQMSEDDLLVIVSDHGTAPCYGHIAVNRWLIDHGYLRLKAGGSMNLRQQILGPISRLVFRLYASNAHFRALMRRFRDTILRDAVVDAQFVEESDGQVPFSALPVDWQNSLAYFAGENRLYLNVSGREPQGIVMPGKSYRQIRNRLRAALVEATVPGSDEKLFAAVQTREELYDGPYLDQAPDLLLTPARVNWELGSAVGEELMNPPMIGGKHDPNGVFIVWGAYVQQGQECDASIYDIAPTVLHYLNAPQPPTMDGSVQRHWFQPDSPVAARDVIYRAYAEREVQPFSWSEKDQENVEAQLRDLGYLE